jgi:hypothetical protein
MSLSPARVVLIVVAAAVAFVAWQLAARPATDARDDVAADAVALVSRADDARFAVAATNLALQLRTTGSYAGASMPTGVVLRRADTASYCVELADGGPVAHAAGPTGSPAAGPC